MAEGGSGNLDKQVIGLQRGELGRRDGLDFVGFVNWEISAEGELNGTARRFTFDKLACLHLIREIAGSHHSCLYDLSIKTKAYRW